ncbi:30S ribosomal protein S4 [Puniceicoccaceae bacterium K14]|nr:30S ribosomal protein S4 [Puniceicoccaceae bacterium K14]
MARYTGPTTKISRRFGQPIFGSNKSFEKRPFPPGQHGPRARRGKVSEYGTGLAEKQKLRFMYGLMEKQFRRAFEKAKSQRGVTGTIFLQILESRLDSVVYQLGFAKTRQAARQFVNHGHIRVNGQKVDIPSFVVSPGDEIEVKDSTSSRQLATRTMEANRTRNVPDWMTRSDESFKGVVNRLPTREEMQQEVNEQLIVEFYSRF